SRWMGRWGMRPVLILTTTICAATMLAIAVAPFDELWPYLVVAFVGGLSTPPVQPAVRTIYPKIVNARQLNPLFALDASAQEVIWIAAPVLISFVSVQISTSLGILIALVFLIG